jgi:acyl-CoA synthetase (AMP-forming)/AMP-acid ligase II
MTTRDLLPQVSEAAEGTAVRGTFVLGETDDAIHVDALLGADGCASRVAIDPRTDIAMVPFSSGTTGMPKGVMLTHRNLVANVCQTGVPNRLTECDVILAVPPFFHVTGIYLLTSVLAHGATLVTMPRFDLRSFLRAIEQYHVTRATVAPPVMLALANEPGIDSFDLSSLKRVTCGAAPLDAELERRCEQRLGCAVGQGYGMTEASPVTHVTPIEAGLSKPGSVGPPIPNTQCKVVDPGTGTELGPNQQGELWVRGPQVMQGYLNRPDATAAAITPDGWLRTGDLVAIDEDGYLFVVDRLKELIKYKGYQVAPAELEAVLLAHSAIVDAAVIPSPDEEAGELPKAFVVLKDDLSAEELMAFVATRVAPYKKVRRLEFVEQIPKSPSGKILRRVLVERERAALLSPV